MEVSNATESDAKKRNPIFVEDFIDVARPFDALRERFSGDGQWLAPLKRSRSASNGRATSIKSSTKMGLRFFASDSVALLTSIN